MAATAAKQHKRAAPSRGSEPNDESDLARAPCCRLYHRAVELVGHRPAALTGEHGPVTNDDVTIALLEFAGGTVGQVTVSRVATGVPNAVGFQLTGSWPAAFTRGVAPMRTVPVAAR